MKKLIFTIAFLASAVTLACPIFNLKDVKCTDLSDNTTYELSKVSMTKEGSKYKMLAIYQGKEIIAEIPSTTKDEFGTTQTYCESDKIISVQKNASLFVKSEMILTSPSTQIQTGQTIAIEDGVAYVIPLNISCQGTPL